jgi:DNA repair protein RadA/Sms
MAKKKTTIYMCQNCGAQSPQELGRCPECGKWGTMVEEVMERTEEEGQGKTRKKQSKFLKVRDIEAQKIKRITTGVSELDRVLGSGIVPGSVVLFAGEPGIGKSTLLTQLALKLSSSNVKYKMKNDQMKVVYVCGEESPEQVKLRLNRVSKKKAKELDDLLLYPETDVDNILSKMTNEKMLNDKSTKLLIVDSIQTLSTNNLSGVAGSISQIRECTHRLVNFAKTNQIPVFLVGHVTKKGNIAGPKTIEHAIDTVLYFEGERTGNYRLLRSQKNRFGPTDEVGVFQMTDQGLIEVTDPSFINNEEKLQDKIGSSYTIIFEGTRPIIIEIQALVSKSYAPMPKRVINGLDRRRSEMLLAVLQKHLGLPLWDYDVFLNVTGGIRVREPAADLAVCSAIYSSYKTKALPAGSVFIGEVSLLGGVSKVSRLDKRKKQANAVGFEKIYSYPKVKNISQIKSIFKK